MNKQKEQIVEALKKYGLIVRHPEERTIEAVLSVYDYINSLVSLRMIRLFSSIRALTIFS